MPKGKHKGKRRVFTNPEQLEEDSKKEQRSQQWRESKEENSDQSSDESAESSDSSENKNAKAKGPAALVDVYNPNRQKEQAATDVNLYDKSKLSRREREAIASERARQRYQDLHAKGMTEEAQADLARLAIVRQQREMAAKKRLEAQKEKEAAKAAAKAK